MGCFSYLCKVCDEPIICDDEVRQQAKLWFLENGAVTQSMEGGYDSYGRVHLGDGEPIDWEGCRDDHEVWCGMIDKHYNDNPGDGFAAAHSKCIEGMGMAPDTVSEDDPNQGWIMKG